LTRNIYKIPYKKLKNNLSLVFDQKNKTQETICILGVFFFIAKK